MGKSKLSILGLVMFGVGALLLTASGGYYAYAQWVTVGRDDLVYATERPTIAKVLSSSETDNERPLVAPPAVPWEDPAEVAKSWLEAQQAEVVEPGPIVIDIQGMFSSGLRGTAEHPAVRAAVVAARAALTAVSDDSPDGPSFEGSTSAFARPTDGRIGAAVTTLNIRQARRGMDLPGYSSGDEVDRRLADLAIQFGLNPYADYEESDFATAPRQPVGQKRENPPSDHMVAEYADIGLMRATNVAAWPTYASRMTVSGISLSSIVEELQVVELDDSRAWETPKHVVGHIPTTAEPGSAGQGWYFGHLESPIRGEGNVFQRLPELAERFKKGEKFQITLDAGDQRYVYEVYRTEVIPQDKLAVTDSGLQDITLVACWPQYVYNERILVTAALVGVVEVPESERTPAPSIWDLTRSAVGG